VHAKLRIIHVQTGQKYAPEFLGHNPDFLLLSRSHDWLEHLNKKYSPDYRVYNGEFDYKIREGNVVREITNQARYDDTMLIVVGTHGVSGVEDRWLGSNAYRLVSHAPCPVLTVRKEMKWESPHRVLLPMDHTKLPRKIVPVVLGFAKLLTAEIKLVALQKKSKWILPGSCDIDARLSERYFICNTSIDVEIIPFKWGGDVRNILSLARDNSITVIAIHLNVASNPLGSFFRPFANDLLNVSDIPVLVVPVKE
jgi:hypothetical protein